MVDVVGLRFVTQGEQQALRALDLWRRGLIQTQNVQDRHVAAMNRAANEQIRSVTNVMRMRARAAREAEQAVQREARAVEQAARREAAAIARRDAEDRRAFQAYLRAQQERERAAQRQARAAEQAAQREAAATAQLARETESLARAYNPVMAASAVYERRVEEINRAHQIGVLTSAQMRAELTRLQAAYTEVGADAARASAFVNNFSAANTFASRRVNHAGMAYQQVGYQVGDFLVQVQSGTNAFVAFGQQATQLVGILPAFGSVMGVSGTALIALSAGLGIAIPLLTAAGALFMRTRRDADEAAEGVDRLASQIQALDSALQDYMDAQRAFRLGVTVEELTGLDAAREAEESLRAAREELQRIRDLQDSLARAPGPEAPFMAIFARRQESARADAEAAALAQVIAAEERLARIRQRQAQEQFSAFSERLRQYQEEIALQEAVLRHGEDSAQVREMRAQQALAEELRRIEAMRQAQEITDAQAGALARAAAEAARLAATDMTSPIDSAADAAARLASNLAFATSLSPTVQGRMIEAGVQSGALPPEALADIPRTEADIVMERLLEDRRRAAARRDAQTGRARSGGGSAADTFTSQIPSIQALQAAIEAAAERTKMYEQEVKLLDQALKFGLITQGQYNAMLQEAQIAYGQALQGAYDYQQALEQVNNRLMSSMENAFVAMVDGSKSTSDAFRDMAREILAEAYRLLVVRPLMQSLFGGAGGGFIGNLLGGAFTASANGNVFSGGRVTAFADGGIVGGPTLFPMRGGTGLMGEAGPEAIMPLKRTSGGKLGVVAEGAQRLNVTVTMDPSTGALGAFVRNESGKIVAAAAPQIIEASKGAMTDTIQRGGATARVFR